MPYVTSPYAPATRAKAANLVLLYGYTYAEAARKTGVHRSTIATWVKLGKQRNHYKLGIPTQSSRPKRPGQRLDPKIVARIVELRRTSGRYAAAIHAQLLGRNLNSRMIAKAQYNRLVSRFHMLIVPN